MKINFFAKKWHTISALITFVLLINSIGSPANAQTQPQFEGIIAFMDQTGNIILASGDGARVPLTTDAGINQNPLAKEQKPSYSIFSFSPNGRYLAIEREILGERSSFLVYDVATLAVVAELDFFGTNPIQWHKDSDSILTHKIIDEDFGNYSNPHHYYHRYYLSGEQVVLFENYKTNNAYQINYDIDTYFELDTRRSETKWGVFQNWAEQTKYEIKLSYDHIIGEWSHDGTRFIHIDNESGKIDIIDVRAGNIIRSIEIPRGFKAIEKAHPGPPSHTSRDIHSSRVRQFLLSPNSNYLLLTDDASGLHQINLETAITEPVFTRQVNDPENHINALWSSSGDLVMLNTYSSRDQKVLITRMGDLSIHVASNAEPLFWLSSDSERLVYVQYNMSGNQVDGELMVFDHSTRISTKIGDLPTIKDINDSPQGDFQQYWKSVDWSNVDVLLPSVLPETNTVLPAPQANATAQSESKDSEPNTEILPSATLPLNFFVVGGLSTLCFAIFIVGAIFVLYRARHSRPSTSRKISQPHTIKPASASLEQIKKAIDYAKENRHQEAFEILREVVKAEPNNMQAWFNLGGVLAGMGNYKDAERCYLRAKQLGHTRGDDALKWLRENRR